MSSDPRCLLIETSGAIGRVGLASGHILLRVREIDRTRRHGRDLAPMVRVLLSELSWQPGNIQVVIISLGPGSYTGLRVGLMSAKAFAYALGCPLVGVPTFEILAWQSGRRGDIVEVVEDAQQHRLYAQRFAFAPDGVLQPQNELHILELTSWLNQLPNGVLVTGPGLKKLNQQQASDLVTAPAEAWEAGLPGLLHLGLRRFNAQKTESPFSLEPIYLRPSSAEEQWTALGR